MESCDKVLEIALSVHLKSKPHYALFERMAIGGNLERDS